MQQKMSLIECRFMSLQESLKDCRLRSKRDPVQELSGIAYQVINKQYNKRILLHMVLSESKCCCCCSRAISEERLRMSRDGIISVSTVCCLSFGLGSSSGLHRLSCQSVSSNSCSISSLERLSPAQRTTHVYPLGKQKGKRQLDPQKDCSRKPFDIPYTIYVVCAGAAN